MEQRCVHYTERDNGTRVLYAPNQWVIHCTTSHPWEILETVPVLALLPFLICSNDRLLQKNQNYYIINQQQIR